MQWAHLARTWLSVHVGYQCGAGVNPDRLHPGELLGRRLGCCARAGQELKDDSRLLREVRLVDAGVVQAVATQHPNAFTAPPPSQAAALAAASPATLLAAAVRRTRGQVLL